MVFDYFSWLFRIIIFFHLPYPEDRFDNTSFLPSSKDYETNHIHRPRLADTVEEHLEDDGRVLVRGVGASGKTVLAWLIGLKFIEKRIPAYYFDFAKCTEASIHKYLINDINTFRCSSSLFVLDNIHLDEGSTSRVALEWEKITQSERPKLLLVGRELFTESGSPLNREFNISTLVLKARQPEVLGVYKRLAWRKTQDTSLLEPRPTVLDQWVKTFGGDPSSESTTTDLIAFGAAVKHRLNELLQGTWLLKEDDAISEIRNAYIKKLEWEEIQNLKQLCSLAELELSINEEVLDYPHHGFEKARKRLGLVFEEELRTSDGKRLFRYRLAHTALGELLLTAIQGPPVNKEKELLKISKKYIFSGLAIIQHLNRLEKIEEAENITKELLKEPQQLLELDNIDRLYSFLELSTKKIKIELPKDIGTVFLTNGPKLKEMMWKANFGHITPFLIFSSKIEQLENVFMILSSELVKEENYARLKDLIWKSCLGHITSFLKFALDKKKEQLDEAFVLVACRIEEGSVRENYDKFNDLIWDASLDHIRQFLEFIIKFEQFENVFSLFIKELLGSEEKLVKKILQAHPKTPMDQLLSFLKFTIDKAEVLATRVIKNIVEDEKNIEELVINAINAPIRNFKSFLVYTNIHQKNQELKGLFNVVCKELRKNEYTKPLAENLSDNPINDLHGFLTFCSNTIQLKPVFDNLIKELMESEEYMEKLLKQSLGFHPPNREAVFGKWTKMPGLDEIAKYLIKEIERRQKDYS